MKFGILNLNSGLVEAFFNHQFFLTQLPAASLSRHILNQGTRIHSHKPVTQKNSGQAELTHPHQVTKYMPDYVC